VLEEPQGGLDDALIAHHQGMGHGQDQMFLHAFDPRSFHGDLAVVGTGDHQAVDPVDGTVSGNDAEFEVDGAEGVGWIERAGAELLAGGAIDGVEQAPILEVIDHFAALIGRAEHDDAAEVGDPMPGEVEADEDSAEGMGDEMEAGAVPQGFMGEGSGDGVGGEDFDGGGAGRVIDVGHAIAFGFEGAGEGLHAAVGPGESVEEDDAFLGLGEWRHAEEEGGELDGDGF